MMAPMIASEALKKAGDKPAAAKKRTVEVSYAVGDQVTVTDGPFTTMPAVISDVEPTTQMVTDMEGYGYPLKVINAYKEHGGYPQYTGAYTVFGQVYEGLDVVDTLSEMKTTGNYKELSDVVIEKAEMSTYHSAEETSA